MRIVVAPDTFKGTAEAADVARAIADGWRSIRSDDEVDLVPMADGGEGTIDAFAAAVPGSRRVPLTVRGPDDRPVRTAWLRLPDGRAVVELAATSGLTLLDRLQPDTAHSVGFGQAIAAALDAGATGLVLGIGGSASTDGGLGMLLALGLGTDPADLMDRAPGADGLDLVARVDASSLRALPRGGAVVVTDVDSPLLGPAGAARVFGPQKGVPADRIAVFDHRLARWASLFPDVDPDTPGAGAAGGVGFGLLAWGAAVEPGASLVARALGLRDRIRDADLVVTGEGRFDAQSAAGKVPDLVAREAADLGVPTALVAGEVTARTDGFVHAVALRDLAGAGPAGDAEDALRDPLRWAFAAGVELARRLRRPGGSGAGDDRHGAAADRVLARAVLDGAAVLDGTDVLEATAVLDATPVFDVLDGAGSRPTSSPHPFLHPVRTLGGVEVSAIRPADHEWHTGLGFAVPDVRSGTAGATNFWGGGTFVRDRGYELLDDHGSMVTEHLGPPDGDDGHRAGDGTGGLDHALAWRDQTGHVVLREVRSMRWAGLPADAVDTGAAGALRGWRLDLRSTLTAVDGPVSLGSPGTNGRTDGGYGGFFWRLPRCSDVTLFCEGGDPDGVDESQVRGRVSPWIAWSARFAAGAAGVAGAGAAGDATLVLAPGDAVSAADPWFVRVDDYPGIGAAIAWEDRVDIAARASVVRGLRVAVLDGRLDHAGAAAVAAALAATPR